MEWKVFPKSRNSFAGEPFVVVSGKKFSAKDVHRLNVELDDVRQRRCDITAQLLRLLQTYVLPNLEIRDQTAALMSNLLGTNPIEAAYLLHYLQEALDVPGAVCEFGVAQGRTSALIAYHLLQSDRQLWLYDSFEGLPSPHEKDVLIHDIFRLGNMDSYKGRMKSPDSLVREQLDRVNFPSERIHIVKGWVEDTIGHGIGPKKVCFAYVDCDFYSPTLCILKSLHDRSSVGSIFLLDDYDFFSSGVKTAVSEFVADHEGEYRIEPPFDTEIAGAFRALRKIA